MKETVCSYQASTWIFVSSFAASSSASSCASSSTSPSYCFGALTLRMFCEPNLFADVDIVRGGEYASTAYVTFHSPHALETAVLLSGAAILDQRVCITRWGHYDDEYDYWNQSTWSNREESGSTHSEHQFVSSAGEAITLTQDVVKTMLAKGYVLGKDALGKAKAFDESHQVSATAASKVAEFSEKIGLTDKICAGVEVVKSVDEKYHVADTTKSAVLATGRSAAAAANAVVNSSYFSKGAFWLSGALGKAAQAAADLGNRGASK